MADEQDSDSCVVFHVWVQVPFSALYNSPKEQSPIFVNSTDTNIDGCFLFTSKYQ